MGTFRGVYTALVTPFVDNQVDLQGFETLCRRQIENGISGLIHISTLGNEYFIHDERNNLLIGEKTGTKFKIGTALKVKLIKSLPNEKKIDFTIVK